MKEHLTIVQHWEMPLCGPRLQQNGQAVIAQNCAVHCNCDDLGHLGCTPE